MIGKLSLDDIIIYEGIVYKINSVHAVNWFSEKTPVLYGLITVNSKEIPEYSGKELYVREELLNHVTRHQLNVWKVLYGESETDNFPRRNRYD